MILPPIIRDSPLHNAEEASPNKSKASSFRKMLTPIFFKEAGNNEDNDDEMDYYYYQNNNNSKKETPDSSSSVYDHLATSSSSYYNYYQGKNNLQYSLLAGIFQGLGTASVAAASVAAEAPTTLTLPTATTMARLALPGFLAFETHHAMSHALYQGVFHEEKRSKFIMAKHANSSTPNIGGVFENVLNYELHIVAGATAGLVYSLTQTALLQASPSRAKTATHMLGFAALFGGYDIYSDVFGSLLLQQDKEESTSTTTPMAVIGLAGGCASMTQASILDLRRNMVSMRTTSMQFAASESTAAAARYASAAATTQATTPGLTSKQLVRAFVPGAAAFLVYERFGTLFSQQQS